MPQNSVFKKIRSFCGYIFLLSVYQCRTKGIALKKVLSLMGASVIALIISCKHQIPGITDTGISGGDNNIPPPTGTCSADTVYFQQQVLPVFISNCAMSGCHDAISHQDGVVLTDYNHIVSTGDIRPGNPGNSEVFEKITEKDLEDRMPPLPRNALSQEQVDLIRKWILQGAKNNSCVNASCDTSNVTYSTSVKSIISNKCQGCHSSPSPAGGYDFSTYAGVKARVNDGKLWGAVNHVPGYSAMPKNGTKLTTCELAKIKKWIDAGAPNN
jgi:mono/diheme cytochrome c family protein